VTVQRFTFGPEQGVPAPVAPYAHATARGGLLAVTGQMPIDPATGELVASGIAEQTDQVMRNLARILELCGAQLSDVMHARAYLVSMDLFAAFNVAYEAWFDPDTLPARTCVAVSGLAVGALVEVDLLVAHS
jgi:2-iminobutanoate/2-iminopropanoate deaminase